MSNVPMPVLPPTWQRVSLDEFLTDIEAGKSFKCNERPPESNEVGIVKVSAVTWGQYDEAETKTVTNGDLVNERLFIAPGDFLFSRANTIELVGACVIAQRVTKRVMLSDKILRFRLRHLDPRWLLHFLRSPEGRRHIERLSTGNQESMRNIGQARIRSIPVPVAPPGESKRIVAEIEKHLTRIDAGVAALERVRANLKRYRASVLKAAVEGSLVPTEAELARAERRDYEPADVLLGRILKERRARWEAAELAKLKAKGKAPKDDRWKAKYVEPKPPDTSDLPELPEGWCWATVEQLRSSDEYSLGIGPFGSNLKVPDYRDEGVPLIFVRNIRAEVFGGADTKYVSDAKAQELRPHWAFGGDLLITKMGDPPGDVAVYPTNAPPAVITADCIRFRPHQFLSGVAFLLYALRSAAVQDQLPAITQGVAQKKVSLHRFRTIAIPLAPPHEQRRLAEAVEQQIDEAARMAVAMSASASRAVVLRQAVLRHAFEGKLVPQDPNDEPATLLLARLQVETHAERASTPAKRRGRPRARSSAKKDGAR